MIDIQNISKSFGRLKALNNISVQFRPGQSIAIVGPNGSGKTTLIKSILGMVIPDQGDILFNGKSIVRNGAGYRKKIGYMPQIGRYPDNMTIGQVFDMMRDLRHDDDRKEDDDLIRAFQMQTLFHKPMRTLSGGTRQKVSAALAFLFHPQVMILDEPTAGLDPISSEKLKEKINQAKTGARTFVITSHIMSDLEEIATHIMYLIDGQAVFYKSLEDIKTESGQERLGKALSVLLNPPIHTN